MFSVRYSVDGQFIAVGYGNGSIEVLSSSTGMLHRTIKSRYQHALPITCLRFNPRLAHQFYAVSSDGNVYACFVNGGEACVKIITGILTTSTYNINRPHGHFHHPIVLSSL